MKRAVIITGGGSGRRMGTPIPKQFLLVAGKPLIAYTIDVFRRFNNDMEIVVVLPAGYTEIWREISQKFFHDLDIKVAEGGETRFHSVKNGLGLLGEERIIGVHDAVRPLASLEVLSRCYQMAEEMGNAIPVIEIPESIRRLEGENSFPVNRNDLRIVQTPQVFRGELLKRAYNTAFREEFTDDASVVENLGVKINLVEGNRGNIKITTQEDLEWVKWGMRNLEFRI
jgi:2-C-methyl-D-erythritol 4-phosphate cytidylyltransferase